MRIKKILPLIIVILVLIIGAISSACYYLVARENVVYEKVSSAAKNVAEKEVKNATPIVVNNMLVGATYKQTFIDANRFYEIAPKNPVKISTFIQNGKTGSYDLNKYTKNKDGNKGIFVDTTYKNQISEYVAVEGESSEIMKREAEKTTNYDKKQITNALQKEVKKLFIKNATVKIREVFKAEIEEGKIVEVVSFTSDGKKENGVYSAVAVVENGKAKLVKLNYIKDVKKSASWPLMSVKFICDLNKDDKYEIVMQEVTDFDVKYSVIEKRGGSYVEVVSTLCEIAK